MKILRFIFVILDTYAFYFYFLPKINRSNLHFVFHFSLIIPVISLASRSFVAHITKKMNHLTLMLPTKELKIRYLLLYFGRIMGVDGVDMEYSCLRTSFFVWRKQSRTNFPQL